MRERPFHQVHGRFDLHAREARRIRSRVNLREIALEVFLDFAPAGSFVGAGKDATFGITDQRPQEDVLR